MTHKLPLGGGMRHDVGAVFNQQQEIGRREGVVNDQQKRVF
jgi:hypothetical protein